MATITISKRLTRSHCRRCYACLARKFNSEANADGQISSKLAVQLRKMSVNQWKLIAQLKEQFSDKNPVMHVVKREWVELVKRLPSITHSVTQQPSQDVTTKSNTEPNRVGQALFESMQAINGFRAKISQNSTPPVKAIADTKWKKRAISTESILSRTKYLISALQNAKGEESVLKRLTDFVNHLMEYPEAAGPAVKQGAVRTLLRIRAAAKCDEIQETAQGALAMVGFVDPPLSKGIRILSIDGGGVRGLLVIEMLRRLEQVTQKRVHEMFDFICGVSTGSILATTIGTSGRSLDDISTLYKMLSTKIFTQNAFEGARSLLWSHGYYDTAMWEQILKDHIGPTTFLETGRKRTCPKIAAVSTVVHQGQIVPFLFRNYEHPYRVRSQYIGSNRYKLWEAARASAAAPAYFGEFRLDNFLHQDGGMLVNNPSAVALHEAKLLWPKHSIQCFVSCGTGRINPTLGLNKEEGDLSKQASWKEKFTQILVSATDTEGVHTILSDLLPSSRYFRFNPYLTEMLSMVEYQPEKLALLEQDAAMYIRRNDEKFAEAAGILTAPKPILDKCQDWLGLQSAMFLPFSN